jgi:nucleoside-diphosphate-sugar epimerase
MNTLITGGTGFIGSRLTLKCLERGDSVRVLGQENTEAEASNRKLIETRGAEVTLATVTDKEKVTAAVKGVDAVFHLAATQHEANVPDQRFWDVNVTGTRNVLEASTAAGVGWLVHGSTIGVYGAAPEGTIDDHTPVAPDNIYGVTKLEGERLALSYADRLPVVAIRISETYGPGDRRLLKLFRAINKRTFVVIGNGENLHHPIYIDDLIEGFLLAASCEAAVGKALVLSGKEPVTTNEMVETIARQLGTRPRGFRAPLAPFLMLAVVVGKTCGPLGIQPPIHPRRMEFFSKSLVFSQEEASRILGFIPQSTFEYGVRETAKWYREMGYL